MAFAQETSQRGRQRLRDLRLCRPAARTEQQVNAVASEMHSDGFRETVVLQQHGCLVSPKDICDGFDCSQLIFVFKIKYSYTKAVEKKLIEKMTFYSKAHSYYVSAPFWSD